MAWFSGYLKWYLSSMLLVCIHELCHLLMAYSFHFQIDKIEILPFGAYLTLKDFFYHPIAHEICVVLAGPCSHLFIYFLIHTFTQGVYHDYLVRMNMTIFLFNLMPIYPLDGGRLIGLLLQSMMDLQKAMTFHLKVSVFALCVLTVFYFRINTCIIIIYLYLQQFSYKHFIPQYLRQYYSQITTLYPRKRICIHHCLEYRRGYFNYYIDNHQIIDEQKMMYSLLKSIKDI